MLEAGTLNRPIKIQSQSTAQDAYGQQTTTWNDVVTCWASIKAATSKEVYAASGFTSQITHKITIRYQDTPIRSNMRVAYRNRFFTIQAVSDADESRAQLALLCLEIDSEAS